MWHMRNVENYLIKTQNMDSNVDFSFLQMQLLILLHITQQEKSWIFEDIIQMCSRHAWDLDRID